MSTKPGQLQWGERDLESPAVCGDHAALGVVDGVGTPDLIGRPWQARLFRDTSCGRRIARAHLGPEIEWGIPEDVPLVRVDDVLRKLHAQIP